MKKWIYKRVNYDVEAIKNRYNITEVTAKILLNRGFKTINEMDEYINPFKVKLTDASKILDLEKAVYVINSFIEAKEKIMIIGDYDVDGVMSSFILYSGLKAFGADVTVRLPHRVKDGYGMNKTMVDEAVEKGAKLIITCDNGISQFEAIEYAKEKGLTVVVTDHHDVPKEDGEDILVPADVVCDCKRSDETYPYHEMCGAGLCYRLIQYMAGKNKDYHALLMELMVFAAIATVCDVVPLTGDNRVIVSFGLKLINSNKVSNKGLRALIDRCEFKNGIDSYAFGFRIGPVINAAGRLESAEDALALLMEKDEKEAYKKADKLMNLNNDRKYTTEKGTNDAKKLYEENHMENDRVLVMYLPECSEAVAGIVAGRIKEAYYRPVYIIVDSENCLKGSGRSIEGYHMQQELQKVKDLTIASGGHALAAGFSLEKENLEAFISALKNNENMKDEDLVEKIKVDVVSPITTVDEKVVKELELFKPFGASNEQIIFADENICFHRVFLCGKENQIGRFACSKDGKEFTVVDFDVENGIKKNIIDKYDEESWTSLTMGNKEGIMMNLAYQPSISSYNNQVQYKYIDAC
ncbi:MAG: single-stranded-DNA-specific exonuclease RecJ [Lachnospiraceae bacterium]|nr:single-stranded-DNA-specific exonuclease RecJ [Lachnospiraceae bacterium]